MNSQNTIRGRSVLLCLAALLAFPGIAFAQSVKIDALVAEVSTAGSSVDPALKAMADSYKRNGIAFTNYKLINRTSFSLTAGQAGSVAVGSSQATVTLVKIESDGKALVRLNAPGSTGEISISPGGEFSQQVGSIANGKLFLVLRR